MKLNGLEKYFETTENGEIVDFIQVYASGVPPLIHAFIYNKEQNLKLTKKQFDYLIKNSDLKQINQHSYIALVYAFCYNKEQNLKLTKKQFDYLIENSDLKHLNKFGKSVLIYALEKNKAQKLNLSNEQWKYMIDNSDLSLIKDEKQLFELKKIQSELLNEKILNKIYITKNINKKGKI